MSGRDVGASVRQRLLNFAMERFRYRLANSPFSDRFVLKGALMPTAWRAPLSRPISRERRVTSWATSQSL